MRPGCTCCGEGYWGLATFLEAAQIYQKRADDGVEFNPSEPRATGTSPRTLILEERTSVVVKAGIIEGCQWWLAIPLEMRDELGKVDLSALPDEERAWVQARLE